MGGLAGATDSYVAYADHRGVKLLGREDLVIEKPVAHISNPPVNPGERPEHVWQYFM